MAGDRKNLSEVRTRAWKTRREKYGPSGHNSSYTRGRPACCPDCGRMRDWLIALHVGGVLSEGQACRATGLDRISVRIIADEIGDAESPQAYLRGKRA